jgi:hypothetical protein
VVAIRVTKTVNADLWVTTVGFSHHGSGFQSHLSLKVGSESLIGTVEVPVWAMPNACAGATDWRRCWFGNLYNLYNIFTRYCMGNAHVVKTVIVVNVLVIEPRAVACLPRGCAYHAELSGTTTARCKSTNMAVQGRRSLPRHVITPFLELHYGSAIVASLPALVFCHLHKTVCLLVPWTLSSCVEFAVAQNANLGITPTATSVLSPVGQVHAYLRWLDPVPASFGRAIKSIIRRVFLVLLVPKPLEFVVEQTVDIFQGYVFGSATSWGHVLGIAYR